MLLSEPADIWRARLMLQVAEETRETARELQAGTRDLRARSAQARAESRHAVLLNRKRKAKAT